MVVGNLEYSWSWQQDAAGLAELRSGNYSACLKIVALVAAYLETVISVAALSEVAVSVTVCLEGHTDSGSVLGSSNVAGQLVSASAAVSGVPKGNSCSSSGLHYE